MFYKGEILFLFWVEEDLIVVAKSLRPDNRFHVYSMTYFAAEGDYCKLGHVKRDREIWSVKMSDMAVMTDSINFKKKTAIILGPYLKLMYTMIIKKFPRAISEKSHQTDRWRDRWTDTQDIFQSPLPMAGDNQPRDGLLIII